MQPMSNVAMDLVPFRLIEDFVASSGVKAIAERPVTAVDVAVDKTLNRPGVAADGIFRPGNNQDREIDRDTRLPPRDPEIVESFDHGVRHGV